MVNKPINKNYLETSFIDFDAEVLEKKYLNKKDPSIHNHENKNVLDKFTESNSTLLFNGKELCSTNHNHGSMNTIIFSATEPTIVAEGEIVMVYE